MKFLFFFISQVLVSKILFSTQTFTTARLRKSSSLSSERSIIIQRSVSVRFHYIDTIEFFFFDRDFAVRFDALFRLEEIYGVLKLSPTYLKKIKQWLHNDEQLLEQIRKQVF